MRIESNNKIDSVDSYVIPEIMINKLSGNICVSIINEITSLIRNSDKGKQQLYNLMFDVDDKIVINALWVMTHYSLSENEWLYDKQNEMINKLLTVTDQSQKRLLLFLLYRQPLSDPLRVDLLDYCLGEMIARKEAPGVTTLCMKLAYEMCRTIPELLQEYSIALDMAEVSQLPPAQRITRKNILKAMQKRKSLQNY